MGADGFQGEAAANGAGFDDGDGQGSGGLGRNRGAMDASGPPTAAIAYPYYTTRGPRDFLDRNPQSIGP